MTEQLASRFRVIAPNLPGYGATTRPPAGLPSDSGHAARLIEALLDGMKPPAVVAGHSYGGVVALLLALRGTVKPGALALFEPVAVPLLAAVGETAAFASARALFDDYRAAFEAGDRLAVRKMIDYWFGSGAYDQMPAPAREYLVNYTQQQRRRRDRHLPGYVLGRRAPAPRGADAGGLRRPEPGDHGEDRAGHRRARAGRAARADRGRQPRADHDPRGPGRGDDRDPRRSELRECAVAAGDPPARGGGPGRAAGEPAGARAGDARAGRPADE